MSHTNVVIRDDADSRLRRCLLEAERKFWADEAFRLQQELENIPRAVKEWGYVEIDGLTLAAKPDDEESAP